MQNKLLPCPLCDKEVSIALMGSEEFHYWWQITRGVNPKGNRNCRCRLFMQSEPFNDKDGGKEQKEDLIKHWNTRMPMEQIVEKLEERKTSYDKYVEEEPYSLHGAYLKGVRRGYIYSLEVVTGEERYAE